VGAKATTAARHLARQRATHPDIHPVTGTTPAETAAELASEFFPTATTIGIAPIRDWPDALTGAATMGTLAGPLLLGPEPTPSPTTRTLLFGPPAPR
jgi:hypothetical protein